MSMEEKPRQNVIAIVYDFDGTLSPDNMQEDTIFKAYGLDKDAVWKKADALVRERGYERTLAYLKILIQDPAFEKKPLTRDRLRDMAPAIRYFPGVADYFRNFQAFLGRVSESVNKEVTVEHYIISSGMKEILEGTEIYKYFTRVYACEYDYGENGPVFPKLVINDTNKTQFLFRICKGKLDLNEDINSHMPEDDRRIPFQNMIYIGDSATDIPSMTVMQKNGGHAIAVFDPEKGFPARALDLVHEKRVDHFAPADFRSDSLLTKILQTTLHKIVTQIAYRLSARMSLDWAMRKRPRE